MLIILPGKPLVRKIAKGRYGQLYVATEKDEEAIIWQIKIAAKKAHFRRCDNVPLPVHVKFYVDKNVPGRPADDDNLLKPLKDCIVKAGLVKDDAVRYLHIIYNPETDYIRKAGVESRTELRIYD